MSLKLFRATGYSSILVPGETRIAMHPGWLVLATSLWTGFVCNVVLWRALLSGVDSGRGLAWALTASLFATAFSGAFLSLLGWRRTFKPAATLLLVVAALVACSVWSQPPPPDAALLDSGVAALLPRWSSLLGWQAPEKWLRKFEQRYKWKLRA